MKYLVEKEEKFLLKTVNGCKGKRAERDFIILFLGFNSGLRCSEIIGLNVGDLRFKEKLYVRPEIAKGKKARTIPLNKKLQASIKKLISLKLAWKEGIQDEDPLFISRKRNRLAKRSLENLFEFWCKKAELTMKNEGREKALYTVHSMRHSFAKKLLHRGIALGVIQKLLGHSSLAATGIYVEAGIEEMEEAVNAL